MKLPNFLTSPDCSSNRRDNPLGLGRTKTTRIFSGDSEINEKTRQNAENKQTFDSTGISFPNISNYDIVI